MDYIRGIIGLLVIVAIAYIFSANRRKVDWRLVLIGIGLQLVFGILITKVPIVASGFSALSNAFVKFLSFSEAGAIFIFGDLAGDSFGFIFAFKVLPTIIFFSTVSAGLYYLGILQKVVFGIAWIMARTMRLSGPESLSAGREYFSWDRTEAPLLVRPFIPNMTKSELMCLMTGGMATIAGGVFGGVCGFSLGRR